MSVLIIKQSETDMFSFRRQNIPKFHCKQDPKSSCYYPFDCKNQLLLVHSPPNYAVNSAGMDDASESEAAVQWLLWLFLAECGSRSGRCVSFSVIAIYS